MKIEIIEADNNKAALCESDVVIIADGQSALDFIASIGHEHGCQDIAISKSAVCEDFFDLTTGIAGEVAQKIVNYHFRLAIIGNFSGYNSKSLRDYIYECNIRGPLYFAETKEEALEKLAGGKSNNF
jgi:hypothetical protein